MHAGKVKESVAERMVEAARAALKQVSTAPNFTTTLAESYLHISCGVCSCANKIGQTGVLA